MPARAILGTRPPSYMSKATLAAELDLSETTVDGYVRRGLLPKPVKIGGSVRWCWDEVDATLRRLNLGEIDEFMQGVDSV